MNKNATRKSNYVIYQYYAGKSFHLFIIFSVSPIAKFSVNFGDCILEQTTENSKVTNQISRKINSFK